MEGKKILYFVILVATIDLIYYGSTEFYRARTYIKNFCQVTKSDADDWNCHGKNDQKCYQPVWAVLYDKPDIDDEPVEGVIRSKSFLSLTDAVSRVKEYQIDQIYTCYHDKAQDEVQWERPDRRGPLIRLALGVLLVPLAFGCWWLFGVCRERIRKHRHSASPVASAEVDGHEPENVVRAEDEPSNLPTAV